MDPRTLLVERILNADRTGAVAVLEAWMAEHGPRRMLADVLDPVLARIGEEWRTAGTFTLAQAYVAAKVAEDAMDRIAAATGPAPAPHRGPVVLGNIEDDFHALGRRMVSTFLRMEGWAVRDLGNDVPAPTFVDEAVACGARVIGASAMMLTTARNIRGIRDELDRRGLAGRIQLAVGGAVFLVRPDLVAEVGGDGTALSALDAPALFAELWERARGEAA